jgi:hypothetical protein
VINKYSNSDKQVLSIVIIVVIVINNSDKQVGLYSGGGAYIWNEVSVSTCGGLIHGGLIFGGGGAYIWNEVSVSTCGGLIHGGLIFGGGGLIFGGLRYVSFVK